MVELCHEPIVCWCAQRLFVLPLYALSLTMYTFDEFTAEGFEDHVAVQHNPLHYIFFLHRLRKHDKEDYTGIETYVLSVLKNAKTATDKVRVQTCRGWCRFVFGHVRLSVSAHL